MPPLRPKQIPFAGLVVGTLDIIAACLQYYIRTGKGPTGVLTFVASGLFGKGAFSGGTRWIVAGLLIHYCISFAFTLFFVLLIKNIAFLRFNRLLTGLLYGVFVWAVMNKIVLPLTQAPALKQTLSGSLQAAGILILCIGLPLAFLLIPKEKT